MKKIFILLLAFFFSASMFASTAPGSSSPNANKIMVPIAKGKVISFHDLAYIKVADYEKITGKKMSFFKRVEFRLAQKKLRNSINEDGSFSDKRMEKMFKDEMSGTTGFHLGGFALGLFLFLIGVLIAYLINDDKKSNRVKWAWIGAAAALVFYLLFSL
jgi:hypothetical protein